MDVAWLRDCLHGARMVGRAPGFSLVALTVFALGIGATTTMFSVFNGLLLNAYPYRDADDIWQPWVSYRDRSGRDWLRFNYQVYRELASLPSLEAVSASSEVLGPYSLADDPGSTDSPDGVPFRPMLVTGDFFKLLGVAPLLGRPLGPADVDASGQARPVAVLSHRIWRQQFASDPAVVGRTFHLWRAPSQSVALTVVGVMPPGFGGDVSYGIGNTMWLPMPTVAEAVPFPRPNTVRVRFRLKSGVSPRSAESQVQALFTRLDPVHGFGALEDGGRWARYDYRVGLRRFNDATFDTTGAVRSNLLVLLAAVTALLAIACANIVTLHLARGSARVHELGVRIAMGATPRRLVRQLLAENGLLIIAGGALGLVMAVGLHRWALGAVPLFLQALGTEAPEEARIALDGTVLLFAVAITVTSGLLAGIAPALLGRRANVIDALRPNRMAGEDVGASRLRSWAVTGVVTLATVLLVAAAGAARNYVDLTVVGSGFKPEGLYVLRPFPGWLYDGPVDQRAFWTAFVERMRGLPNVEAAAFGDALGDTRLLQVAGHTGDTFGQLTVMTGDAEFLSTMGTRVRAGRPFTADEAARGERVALVNETGTRLFSSGPLGRFITVQGPMLPEPLTFQIIGLTNDIRHEPATPAPPTLLVPHTTPLGLGTIVLRSTHRDVEAVRRDAQAELLQMRSGWQARGRPSVHVSSLEEPYAREMYAPRFRFILLTLIGGIGVVFTLMGLYGVLSYHVSRQTRAIGLRLALGASRGQMIRHVIALGARPVVLGLVLGAGIGLLAWLALDARVLPLTMVDIVFAVGVLTMAALAACWIPARRALRVDPITSLRSD